jgi:hypothetical protein
MYKVGDCVSVSDAGRNECGVYKIDKVNRWSVWLDGYPGRFNRETGEERDAPEGVFFGDLIVPATVEEYEQYQQGG